MDAANIMVPNVLNLKTLTCYVGYVLSIEYVRIRREYADTAACWTNTWSNTANSALSILAY